MKKIIINDNNKISELDKLSEIVRDLVSKNDYQSGIELICKAMSIYPDAPHPHNLLGIILEKKGEHSKAMNHFRAAWALDATYRLARYNLETYGTFFSKGKCAFSDKDVQSNPPSNVETIYDEKGIGHIVNKTKIEYDKYGIGHMVRR